MRQAAPTLSTDNFMDSLIAAFHHDHRAALTRQAKAMLTAPADGRIAISVTVRTGKARSQAWVVGCSFDDGPGYKIQAIRYSTDRAKAFAFSNEAGREVATQLAGAKFRLVGVTMESAR